MRCMKCGQHASFNQTVFQGASPTTVKLCGTCAETADAERHVDAIRSAPDKETKTAAVSEFLRAIGA